MNKPVIEFFVYKCAMHGNQMVIDGRCNHGPITLDSRFNVICEVKSQRSAEAYGPSVRKVLYNVSLFTSRIYMYGTYVNELSEGVTGRLTVEGEGLERIQDRLALAFINAA